MTQHLIRTLALASLAGVAHMAADKASGAAAPAETQIDSTEGNAPAESGSESTAANVNANKALVPLLDETKTKAIRTHLGDRNIFVTGPVEVVNPDGSKTTVEKSAFEQASEHLSAAVESGKLNFDPEASTLEGIPVLVSEGIEDAAKITIATLGARDKGDAAKGIKARNGYKAVLIYPAPSVEDFLSDESEGVKDWVAKLIEREAADVAFSGVRAATTLAQLQTVFAGMPTTVSDITTRSRESAGLDTEAFDSMWTPFRTGFLREKAPAVESALPQKPDVIKAIRSKSYALANPKTKAIEEAGFWVKIAQTMIKLGPTFKDKDGKPMPLDMSSVQEWLDGRDELNLSFNETIATADQFAGIDF